MDESMTDVSMQDAGEEINSPPAFQFRTLNHLDDTQDSVATTDEEEEEDELDDEDMEEDEVDDDTETVNGKSPTSSPLKSKPERIASITKRQVNLHLSGMPRLKKDDGQPLWRRDLQYDFLQCLFADQTKAFTLFPQGTGLVTFRELYMEALLDSPRISNILKTKLRKDEDMATSMLYMCVLVNIGRMNTTFNFFPAMKAQFRTYHPVPALQWKSRGDYKSLQDAPRVKSILKATCENSEEPATLDEVKDKPPHERTNPINLLFLLVTHAKQVTEDYFPPEYKFQDLIVDSSLSSKSRARALLWLFWTYLESDFETESLKRNPFAVTDQDYNLIPPFHSLSKAEEEKENIDSPEELAFAEDMRVLRYELIPDSNAPPATRPRPSTPLKKKADHNETSKPSTEALKLSVLKNHKIDLDASLSETGPTIRELFDSNGNIYPLHVRAYKEAMDYIKRKWKNDYRSRVTKGPVKSEWTYLKSMLKSKPSQTETPNSSLPIDKLIIPPKELTPNFLYPEYSSTGEYSGHTVKALKTSLRRTERWGYDKIEAAP
ncbi:hypothetical protein CANCADRAFT_56764 [Tortispora caseinolytica NRRL Y-17796]|uniref:Ino eighty subunit 1 n=1 Tax=Tortispora caseinolytica NRRL Y-17796 TaxID=767744 RepID=A0A1E4TEJ2_9ASCO|nr:hypothetical protein CANCADRAFT_56764 [Tortispora caseinolytica NRRL Y-17796]